VRYPTLSNTNTVGLSEQLAGGQDPSVDPHVEWFGSGDEVALAPIADAADAMAREFREWTDSDRDRFEGKAATALFKALENVPPEVLDDRGFWRFLSIRSVLPRMYLRIQAVGGEHHGPLAAAVPHGTDFWRSHVLRVRSGSVPAVARAFARKQAGDRLMTDSLRQAARRLNRTWANVVLNVYDDSEATDLIQTIWDQRADD